MISVYTTAFNIEKNKFDINSTIENFSQLADEICIATIPDNEDNTQDILQNIVNNNSRVKVFMSYDTNSTTFAKDGKLKNIALQNCSNNICVQLDGDERINNPNIWKNFIKANKEMILDGCAFMIPVINLYKDKNHYRDIGAKWYIHRKKGMYRGIVNFARRSDGKFDKDKSDGCELIDELGNLSKSINITYHPDFKDKSPIEILKTSQIPFVIHYGYQDLSRRGEINKNFWQNEWSDYSGKDVILNTQESDFKDEYFKHGLDI
jgi:hypothetical protein